MTATKAPGWQVRTEADLRAVYQASYGEVYRYAARLAGPDRATAEDLVQDAFVSMVRAVRAGKLQEVTVGWLITAIRNRFTDLCRRNQTAARHLHLVGSDESTRGPADRGDTTDTLGGLQPIERLAVVLHHIDGYPVKQVASMIGKSASATESILARARQSLKSTLSATPSTGPVAATRPANPNTKESGNV